MPGGKDVTVAVQALDGTWETLGVDRVRGVWPENVSLSADAWGPSSASFDLHRDPAAPWPDVGAFTPVDIWVGGVKCWAGRVKETPARDGQDRVLSVQCEGWQYHLDDDVYFRAYVHNRLSDWTDVRSNADAGLGASAAAAQGTVSTDGGIMLSLPRDMTVAAGTYVGVYLDLGQVGGRAGDGWANRISIDYKTSQHAGFSFHARTTDGVSAADLLAGNDAANWNGIDLSVMGAANTQTGGFSTPKRYVILYLQAESSAAGVNGADVWVQLTGVRLYTNDAWESGHQSVLRAEHVVNDMLSRGVTLLSPDTSQIDPNNTDTFSIPAFTSFEPQTPRSWLQGVNAYKGWTTAVDAERRMVFRELESAPRWEVGQWSAMEFEDASANSGEDIYNRVIVTGQTPTGDPYSKTVWDRTTEPLVTPDTAAVVPNPGFEVDNANWTMDAGGGSITRSTTYAVGSTASGMFTSGGAGIQYAYTTISGLVPGNVYRIDADIRGSIHATTGYPRVAIVGAAGASSTTVTYGQYKPNGDPVSGSWVVLGVEFMAASTSHAFRFVNSGDTSTAVGYIDNVRVMRTTRSLPDRRGFKRTMILPISTALPEPVNASYTDAQWQIGSTWLSAHKTTPFRGSVSLTGDALRDVLTGQAVGLEQMLLAPQALIRFSDRIDPDTGAYGRDGRLATVTYTPATDTASVAIDSTRSQLDVLLARLAVISER